MNLNSKFSIFNKPIFNKKPEAEFTLQQVYEYITTNHDAKKATEKIRAFKDEDLQKYFKVRNFKFATFSGTFSSAKVSGLKKHSNLLCLDIDHISTDTEWSIDELKAKMIADEELEVLLLFTSPRADGIKAVVPVGATNADDHKLWFEGLKNYMLQHYNVEIDTNCSDVSRRCFLPYDAEAYINPKCLNND